MRSHLYWRSTDLNAPDTRLTMLTTFLVQSALSAQSAIGRLSIILFLLPSIAHDRERAQSCQHEVTSWSPAGETLDPGSGCAPPIARRTRNYGVIKVRGTYVAPASRQLIVCAQKSNSVSVFVQSDYGESF